MPDETVETRPPWLDFSLPRRPCLGISVLYSIILQTLNSCAIRPPDSTACPPPPAYATYAEIQCAGPHLRFGRHGAHSLHCFPLDTLYSPEGMQCVLKEIMNCREVPYSLITRRTMAHPQSIHTWARG